MWRRAGQAEPIITAASDVFLSRLLIDEWSANAAVLITISDASGGLDHDQSVCLCVFRHSQEKGLN